MNIQCESCREVVPLGAFRSTDEGIHVTCRACGASFFVAADQGGEGATEKAAPTPSAERAVVEPAAGEMLCPKCETLQPETDACRVCGLRRSLFDTHEVSQVDGASPTLAALWTRCEADWDDAEHHKRFADAAATERAFVYAVRRYRGFLRRDPGNATAVSQLERLTRMAEATLMAEAVPRDRETRDQEPYRNVLILVIVLLLVGGAVGMYALLSKTGPGEAPPPPPVVNTPVRPTL